ncbi:MAG: 50S ribosomal protein L25 [Sphaerochaetaceae bacterium]|nr:50S ribosomal protein L25 [Sphaerochaetaceae bacterium]
MSDITLKACVRKSDFGSAGSRRLVRSGSIPAIIYGKEAPLAVVINAKEFTSKQHLFSETTIIKLDVEGTVKDVFVKAVQEDFLKGIINHVDFFEITYGVLLRTKVQVVLEGTPVGVKTMGGVLEQVVHEVEIECFPRNLPKELKADVSALKLFDTVRVADLVVPAEVKVLADADETIATVKGVKEEVAAPAAETAEAAPADAEAEK